MKICIVGGVAGGASAATRLRRLDEKAEIVLFEKGEHISYANCGLPYYLGGTIRQRDSLIVTKPELLCKRFRAVSYTHLGLFAEISSLPVIKIIKTAAHHLNNNLIFICFLRLQSGYQTAVLEHIDVIGYLKYLLETVRHEDEGDPLLF